MTLSINTSSNMSAQVDSGLEVIGAKLAKNNQEREGQLALQLIQAADISAQAPQSIQSNSTGALGANINIKV